MFSPCPFILNALGGEKFSALTFPLCTYAKVKVFEWGQFPQVRGLGFLLNFSKIIMPGRVLGGLRSLVFSFLFAAPTSRPISRIAIAVPFPAKINPAVTL